MRSKKIISSLVLLICFVSPLCVRAQNANISNPITLRLKATPVETSTGRIKAMIPLVSKMGFDFVGDYQKDADPLVFHPNSRLLMGINHNAFKLWDAETGQPVLEITAGRVPAAFSPDGHLLVTAGKDKKSVLVYEIKGA